MESLFPFLPDSAATTLRKVLEVRFSVQIVKKFQNFQKASNVLNVENVKNVENVQNVQNDFIDFRPEYLKDSVQC